MSEFDYPSFNGEHFASETLVAIESIYQAANNKLNEKKDGVIGNPIANANDFNSAVSYNQLRKSSQEVYDGYRSIVAEPAIARITLVNKHNEIKRYYVTRRYSVVVPDSDVRVASYRSRIGQLASYDVGDEYRIDGELYELVEKAKLFPQQKKQWDSIDTYYEGDAQEFTISSLLTLIAGAQDGSAPDDGGFIIIVDDIDDDTPADGPFSGGRKRPVIGQPALSDTAVLDKMQVEVFRLPINSRLFLYGPPGTGKTTTLIKRLALKLDEREGVTEEERYLLTNVEEPKAWLMFTPSELLRQYVKEAFVREGVLASSEHIHTWDKYRIKLGSECKLLATPNRRGFQLDKEQQKNFTAQKQITYYERYKKQLVANFGRKVRKSIAVLRTVKLDLASEISTQLAAKKHIFQSKNPVTIVMELSKFADKLNELEKVLKEEQSRIFKDEAKLQQSNDPNFLSSLYSEIKEGDDSALSKNDKSKFVSTAYKRALIAYCEKIAVSKVINKGTQQEKIVTWLGKRVPSKKIAITFGKIPSLLAAIKVLTRPLNLYFKMVSSDYVEFRTNSSAMRKQVEGALDNALAAEELDILLLSKLSIAHSLLSKRDVVLRLETPLYSSLKDYLKLMRPQIMVDEATDFSPIQLGCMRALSSPNIDSFFACGDFNQRITAHGVNSLDEFEWAVPKLSARQVETPYRQSHYLQRFVLELVGDLDNQKTDLSTEQITGEREYPPVLGLGLNTFESVVDWLSEKIIQVYLGVGGLSSIAVLVNSEQEVDNLANMLSEKLPATVPVLACPDGNVLGDDAGVRVFNIQHIKGMEFEAAFFVGVDELVKTFPELYSKFLYVGATRAASFLGFTCGSKKVPAKIRKLSELTVSNWDIFCPVDSAVNE